MTEKKNEVEQRKGEKNKARKSRNENKSRNKT